MAKLKDETGVTVEWLLNPYDQVLDKLMHLAAAGTPPDTASVPVTHYQTLAKAGALVDIGELIASDPVVGAEDFFLEPLETERSTYQGRWYGIAHGWAFPLLYYNADVFREEGIDPPSADPDEAWTWDHFLEVGRRLTWDAKGKHPGESGFDPGGIERWAVHWYRVWVHLHAAVQSNGGQWVDPITRLLALDQPAASEAIQRVADLTLVDHVLPQSDAVFSQLGMNNTQMLENRRLAMAVDGTWMLMWGTKMEATLGVAVIPKMVRPATDVQCPFFSILNGTRELDACWQWVRFLVGPWFQLEYGKSGLSVPGRPQFLTPEGVKQWLNPTVHPPGYETLVSQYMTKYGHVLVMPPGWPEADAAIYPALDAIWTGRKTADEALKEAVPKANEILRREA